MEGGQSELETYEESLELVALGKELKGQLPGSLCSVIPHTAEAVFLPQSTAFHVTSAWGEAIALPTGVSFAPPCGAYDMLKSTARGSFNAKPNVQPADGGGSLAA